ncbi:Nuclear transcription factor Y subunit C-4 [Podochytrium sp. JEL0797]|nr:Nuclear transcription factor Y subunit C-4 [Podochytrium sp. JEL0797]
MASQSHSLLGAPQTGGGNQSDITAILDAFWTKNQVDMTRIDEGHDWKFHQLPLARIKKVMKLDEDAATMMISSEVPILFAKACEFFILELTLRSWVHTEDNKRRTLQKSDVATALSRQDMYDFLIDIVPRDEVAPAAGPSNSTAAARAGASPTRGGGMASGAKKGDA